MLFSFILENMDVENMPDNISSPERETSISERHKNWLQCKLEAFVDTHPLASQALLAGSSAAALIEHLATENRWSPENPTLPLTLAVVFSSASLSRWLRKRWEGLQSVNTR